MTEEKKEFIPDAENDGMELQLKLTPEEIKLLKEGIEKAANNTQQENSKVDDNVNDPNIPPVNKQKYPSNVLCRCNMKFFLVNGMEYQNEINVTMDRIQFIQEHMAKSMENKEGAGVIYLEGSKNFEADFTVIPVRNILYVKFQIEDFKKA